MRVLVCGSRHYNGYADFCVEMNKLHSETPISCIIHGGAKGADSMAQCWAGEHNVNTRIEYPDWQLYGKAAGPIRNRKMLEHNPDLVIAFLSNVAQQEIFYGLHSQHSRGTRDMINAAHEKGVPVKVVEI